MDREARQLLLEFATAEERSAALGNYLRAIELPSRQVVVLCTIAGLGELIQVETQRGSRLQISKSGIAAATRRLGLHGSPNTWLAGAADLERRNLLSIVRVTSPWTYVVCWDRIGRLEPPAQVVPALESLPVFRLDQPDTRSGGVQLPVRPGQHPRVRVERSISNPCLGSVSEIRDTCPAGLADRMRRPWDRHRGLTGDDLVWSVTTTDLARGRDNLQPIRALWREALLLEWITGSEDSQLRFLTACHHVATVVGISNRMAALVARVKVSPVSVERVRQASEDWAAAVIAARHRDPELRRESAVGAVGRVGE